MRLSNIHIMLRRNITKSKVKVHAREGLAQILELKGGLLDQLKETID